MFVKVFMVRTVRTMKDIYMLHIRVPMIDKLMYSISEMMSVPWRLFPMPLCRSASPTYSPVWRKTCSSTLREVRNQSLKQRDGL